MTSVRVTMLVEELRRAGLLVSEHGVLPQTVSGIADDSRAVTEGGLFLAVRGSERDGHDYLGAAEKAGAAVAVVDDASRTNLPSLVVTDARRAAAVAAAAFFGDPARDLRLVGVTGTNGKTTTVGMLRHLLDNPVEQAASIGTLGVLIGSAGESIPGGAGLTTPGPVELQRVLRTLLDRGVRTVAMEASSHALQQGRLEGLRFEAGVFTNFTRDHLDYHLTMDAYLAAKAILVSLLTPGGAAVVNADDAAWNALPSAPRTLRFGGDESAEVRARDVTYGSRGSDWTLVLGAHVHHVHLPLIGDFNVSNALAAAAAAWALGMQPADIARRLATLPQVPGRLEIISQQPLVLRDYAHTPDALARTLDAVRPFTTGELIVVFGCGGDRDRGKRPEMGRIAQAKADRAIVTSDNPRTEDPERILDDIETGMAPGRHERFVDRREAIGRALAHAAVPAAPAQNATVFEPVIVLAGKGHETYQIRGTMKFPFDERVIVREILDGTMN